MPNPFKRPANVDTILAPMAKIVAKLNAFAEKSRATADEKAVEANRLRDEADACRFEAARAERLSKKYGSLVTGD
ncbi:hypothetical protein [Ancylobacter rudongensis]|uniref:Uncharacterized protein n=1 Tax=Ancylobacter rudongensis TaxID=177413 RepID=A0A1G4UQ81_9HYPH|nr:hypothetical protein [Ancylobacter rudongensis]SCW95782.1 hypothetical protein SAMN05660859_0117 [Ancylobacter rudongensis]